VVAGDGVLSMYTCVLPFQVREAMKMAGIDVHKKVFDGSGGGYECAAREAGTATIRHAASGYSDSESGYKSKGWKKR